jgi:hypothetical protein
MNRNWQTRLLFASVLAAGPMIPASLFAKQNAAPAPVAPSTPAVPETLATLGDHKLMEELADRGLDTLLDRYFDLHKTPESEQKAIKSMEGLRDLSDPKLSNGAKEQKVKQIVAGINTTLPSLKDPVRLAQDAGLLLLYGVTRDANLLEYWGENPATQARLRPNAQAVYDMLGKASKEASVQAAIISPRINVQNQNTLGAQWEQLDNLSQRSKYNQNMMAYYLALAMPQAERGPLVDRTLKYLEDLDNADTAVMPLVHVAMGKLNLVKGNNDEAIRFLSAVAASDKSIQPPPEAGQIYEARYFQNVALIQAGRVPEAKTGLESLITWEKASMPKDADMQKGVAAAAEMLRYRIFLAEAAKATDPTARKNAETAASNVLLKLKDDRPELRGIIYQQLVERLPKDAAVKDMDPLLLGGLMSKGLGEANKPEGATLDQDVLKRGLAAAVEMSTRKNATGITPAMRDEAARFTPVLTEATGDKITAANEYLKYAQDDANVQREFAANALDDAGRLTFELRKTMTDDPQVSDLYTRFLPVAINQPFNKVQLAYFYGQRLQATNKSSEAIKYFRMVAKADRNYNNAQYYMMQAMQDQLDTPKLPPAQRQLLANELLGQARHVEETYAGSQDVVARERAAIAILTAAETSGADLKKPDDTLKILTGFEDAVKGTPDEKLLVTRALLARVNANMATGKLKAATDTLVALLNQTGGAQGADFVRGLLDRLDKDLEKAEAAHDATAMRDIAKSEADLSGFLVQWASTNTMPEIKKYTYQYMVFDARTKRLAGTLAQEPTDRATLLQQAMAAYKTLQQPQNAALFKATLDQAKIKSGDIDPNMADPNVTLGVALTNFELKDYKDASTALGDLLNSGKLGSATLLVNDPTGNGEQKVVDNDTYWEATYKLYASNIADAKGGDDAAIAGTKQGLKNILVRGGIPIKWQDKFEDLRKQVIPDFDVASLLNATTQPATTQPVSAR